MPNAAGQSPHLSPGTAPLSLRSGATAVHTNIQTLRDAEKHTQKDTHPLPSRSTPPSCCSLPLDAALL